MSINLNPRKFRVFSLFFMDVISTRFYAGEEMILTLVDRQKARIILDVVWSTRYPISSRFRNPLPPKTWTKLLKRLSGA